MVDGHTGGDKPVGPRWASNFVKREGELKSRLKRQRDRQRVLCSDPGVIGPWFDLVQNVKAKYSILAKIPTTLTRLASRWALETELK